MTPAEELRLVPEKRIGFGVSKFAWFKMLKNSARNCKLTDSFRTTRLNNRVSALNALGPRSAPSDRLPKVPVGGSEEALGSKYRPVFLSPSAPRTTFPLKLGFQLGRSGTRLSPFPDWLRPIHGVTGK